MTKYENNENLSAIFACISPCSAKVLREGESAPPQFMYFMSGLFFALLISCTTNNSSETNRSERECPKGHTDNVIPIQYGMPDESSMEAAERGEIYLGGCEVTDDSSKWFCKEHEILF